MINEEDYRSFLPAELYAQIAEICADVRMIHEDAAGLLVQDPVPDATAQLNNVLQSTEEATNTIIDCVTSMQGIVDQSAAADETKAQIAEQVTKVYEACNFQDLTGQRIKKVLRGFASLEERLGKLSATMEKYATAQSAKSPAAPAAADPLMNGPQLTADAPSQADIDKLFGS